MTGHSTESLLAWMQDITRLRGWDAVIALDGKAVNGLLAQTWQLGVGEGLVQPVPDASVEIPDTNITHVFSDFILGPPALSFNDGSLESAPLAWRMSTVSGVHTVLESDSGHIGILKVFAYDPCVSPSLRLDLELTSQGPALQVDLGLSENALLDFTGSSAAEQRETGRFLQDWLRNPQNPQRVVELGVFGDQSNPLLKVRRIDARTQLESPEIEGQGVDDSAEGRGALLLFTTLEYGATGGIPDADADFRYLIPNDAGEDYSATAVISSHALHRAALGHAVMQVLENPSFEFIVPAEKPLAQMIATEGKLGVEQQNYKSEEFEFQSDALSVPVIHSGKSLTLDFQYTEAAHIWNLPVHFDFKYKASGASEWQSRSEDFDVNLKYVFGLVPSESDDQGVESSLYFPYEPGPEVSLVQGKNDDVDESERSQINGFVAHTLKQALMKAFGETLQSRGYERFLNQFNLGDRQALQSVKTRLPHDLAVFGKLEAASSGFRVVEQQSVVTAGEELQLTTRPVRTGLVWSVDHVAGESGAGSPGTIGSTSGVYRAPGVQDMTQVIQHVLVTVTEPVSGQFSTAVVTLQRHAISLNPLIQVCDYGARVGLSAGSLSENDLDWLIVNEVPGESGTLEPDDNAAHAQSYVAGPKVPNRTYVLDKVEVSDGKNSSSAWVLVRQQQPMLTIEIVPDGSLAEDEVRLEARYGGNVYSGVEWYMPEGLPGTLSKDGVYKGDPAAPDRFVIIFVRVDDILFDRLEGHLILPLPLSRHGQLLQKLSAPRLEGSTLNRLLDRSNAGTLTQGWGAIMAIGRDALNRQLEQQYVERHRNLSFFPLFTGSIVIDSSTHDTVFLRQIELGVPTLALGAAGRIEGRVTMNVLAGSYLRQRRSQAGETTVTENFKVTEDMHFHVEMTAPLVVDGDCDINLDLSGARDFTCNLARDDETANSKLAGFLKEKFPEIPSHRSVFFLLGIDVNQYQAQSPANVRLLTRAAPGAQFRGAKNFGDGALVLLIQMRGNKSEGRFPLTSDFPYPIPASPEANAGNSYDAALIVSNEMLRGSEHNRQPLLDSLRSGVKDLFAQADTRAAGDLLMFGVRQATQASITPLFSTIVAAETQSFMLHNEQGQTITAQSWKVFSLQGHRDVQHGFITSNGVYTAANAAQMGYDSLRVVVNATYDDGGMTRTATALLSVVSQAMELAPRAVVVAGSDQVRPVLLKASTVDGEAVDWTLQGPQIGSLSEVENGVLFTPVAKLCKRALNVQRIVAQSGQKKMDATVLIANGQQVLRIEPSSVPGSRKGVAVQLREDAALLAGNQRRWKMAGGAGSVDAQGVFTPPEDYVGTSVVSCEIVSKYNVILASGYSVINVSEVEEAPTWSELTLFTIKVPNNSANAAEGHLYANGYQQLEVAVEVETMPVDGQHCPLSPMEAASLRLTDVKTRQAIGSLVKRCDLRHGIAEGDQRRYATSNVPNRFVRSAGLANAFAQPEAYHVAESRSDSSTYQDFYLHARTEPNSTMRLCAEFQKDNGQWFASDNRGETNSEVIIISRPIPGFGDDHYSFKVVRVQGDQIPTPTPPPEGESDYPFTLVYRSTDYWLLGLRYNNASEYVRFEVLKFMPWRVGEDVEELNISTILWESEQSAEEVFSCTGSIFLDKCAVIDPNQSPDPCVAHAPGKVLFDEGLKRVINDIESLDIDVVMTAFEAGKLVISLHRFDNIPFIKAGDPNRDRLYRPLGVWLHDEQGNIHKRSIHYLPDGVGRRNRLTTTNWSDFKKNDGRKDS